METKNLHTLLNILILANGILQMWIDAEDSLEI